MDVHASPSHSQRCGGNAPEEMLGFHGGSEWFPYGGSSYQRRGQRSGRCLVRNKRSLALSLMQGAEPQPEPVADGVLDVMAWSKPNWTDEGWVRLWDIS